MPGIVYLVGAGPGDPGLLTVRARELLERCDAVVYDALANPALLALASGAELHEVGKRGGQRDSARQDDINTLLVRLGGEGKRVVRLKGGDPFVFGRGSEEAQALAAAGIPFEVVPGVTAGIAAPAYAGIPVTHRAVATSVTFVTGHEDPTKEQTMVDWHALGRAGGTIVLYMGVKALPQIVASLLAAGRGADTPAAAVRWGTYPHQRTVVATLGTLVERIEAEHLSPPVITVIGPVVALREQIAWLESRPLFGKRIVVTRAREQASTLSEALRERGATVIETPATHIQPLDAAPLRAALAGLGDYQWAVFTSRNAVELFWSVLRAEGRDARALAGVKLAAVGPSTADALAERGLVVDVTPERFVAEGVLEALRARDDVRGARVLYACAAGARDVLPRGLGELGASVDRIEIYRSVPDEHGAAELRARVAQGGADLVTFTSASAVQAFVAAVGDETARALPAASIGPVTSGAARAAGIAVVCEAEQSTIAGLVDAVATHYARR